MKLKILPWSAILFTLSCSPHAAYQYLTPTKKTDKVVEANNETFDPKADILFVVDNSRSMDVHQANLAANIGLFTSVFLQKSVIDYNMAVVVTDTKTFDDPCCGKFYGRIKVVNKSTPDGNKVFAENVMPGVSGDGFEKVFDPIVLALSEPTLSTYNKGFLRPDAALVVVFLTDAEDQSENYDAQQTYDFLLKLKNGDRRKVLSFGAIIPSSVTDPKCHRDPAYPNESDPAPLPRRIESFLALTQANGGNEFSLCDKDFGRNIGQFAMDIVNQIGSYIYLSRQPELSTLRVTYGKMDLPKDATKGWSFDAEKNAIHLGDEIDWTSQPAGSQVKVYYNAAQ